MAITRGDYEVFKRVRGLLPPSPKILELGEAEFYGDVPLTELGADIKRYGNGQDFMDLSGLTAVLGRGGSPTHSLARLVYRVMFRYARLDSVDMHGTVRAIKADLNRALDMLDYDLVYNTGTAEHVFDIARVLKTCHGACGFGGIMVHCFPFTGLTDHGFWAVQPTLIHDLAAANGYEIVCMAMSTLFGHFEWLECKRGELRDRESLPDNAWLHVAYRKTSGGPFVIPMQGHYCQGTTQEEKDKWLAKR